MTFPGIRPRKGLFRPITLPRSILQQFQLDWLSYGQWSLSYLHSVFRHVIGLKGTGDYPAINDLHRSGRFDIASHYNRALDPMEPHNLTSVEQILHPAGRRLAILLDHMTNLQTAIGIEALSKQKVFSGRDMRHNLPQNILMGLGLGSGATTGDYQRDWYQAGEGIVRVLANVYYSQPSEAVSEEAYHSFNQVVALDPYFLGIRAETGRYLADHGVESQGVAKDVLSAYIVTLNKIIIREVEFIKNTKPSFFGTHPIPSFDLGFKIRELDDRVMNDLRNVAELMAFSLGEKRRSGGFQGLTEEDLRYFKQGK